MPNHRSKTSSQAGSIILTILLFFCLFLIAEQSFGAETEAVPDDGTIEVVYPADRLVPYRDRRSNFGITFAIQMEQVYPNSYLSRIEGDAFSYEQMFGETTLNLIQGQLGAKYNFGLGSIGASALLGAGSIYDTQVVYLTDDGAGGRIDTDSELQLTKMGIAFNFTMDTLFAEPYIAPYFEAQILKFDWLESAKGYESVEGSTDISTAFSMGVLIQLNWLDPASAFEAQNTSGLQNTYLDVFVSQYNGSASDTDPNFQTDINYGAGLKFEF